MSRHFAVFGHPVAHSLSPRIHAAFGKQAGIDLDYVAIDAQPALQPRRWPELDHRFIAQRDDGRGLQEKA